MDSDEEALVRNSPSVKALKAKGRAPHDITDLRGLEKEFEGASDRAYVILWAAVLEDYLRQILPYKMRQPLSATMKEIIFEDGGPLETFSAKIKLGFTISLFGRKTYHDLEIIRALRNEFAHCRKPLHFSTPEVSAVCATLLLPDLLCAKVPPNAVTKARTRGIQLSPKDAQTRYAVAAQTVIINLVTVYERNSKHPLTEDQVSYLLP
jgi:DNA-binding MltR family transcriptional regulator